MNESTSCGYRTSAKTQLLKSTLSKVHAEDAMATERRGSAVRIDRQWVRSEVKSPDMKVVTWLVQRCDTVSLVLVLP